MSKMNINLTSTWNGGFRGNGKVRGDCFDVPIAVPTSFGGSGEGANPKELFTSATAACFLTTLRAITENKKLPVDSLAVTTEADTDENHFSIKHTVDLRLGNDATDDDVRAAEKMIQSADDMCIVGNLAKKAGVSIDIVPAITRPA